MCEACVQHRDRRLAISQEGGKEKKRGEEEEERAPVTSLVRSFEPLFVPCLPSASTASSLSLCTMTAMAFGLGQVEEEGTEQCTLYVGRSVGRSVYRR